MILYILLFIGIIILILFRKTLFPPKPDINSDGKAIFVTGAASGIGKATVENLLSKHSFVFAADVNETALQSYFGSNSNVKVIKLDVTSQKDMDDAIQIVKKEGRGLYGMVNCAGIAGKYPNQIKCGAETHVENEARMTIEINLLGTMRVCHGLLDFILESKGVIVNVTSVFGRVAVPGAAIYCTTKHGLNAYTACIRRELQPKGVRVIAIEPGGVKTPLLMSTPMFQEPDMSKTKVLDGSLREKLSESWIQSPEMVAAEIVRTIFTSSVPTPHLVVDFFIFKIRWWILSSIPHTWLDFLLEKTRKRKKASEKAL